MGMGMYPPMMGGAPGQHMMQPPWGGGQTDAQPQPQHQQGGGSQPMSIQQQLQQQSLLQQQQQVSIPRTNALLDTYVPSALVHNSFCRHPEALLRLHQRLKTGPSNTIPCSRHEYFYVRFNLFVLQIHAQWQALLPQQQNQSNCLGEAV
jgi:hypothetical protein